MAQSCFRIGSFDAVVIQYSIFAMPMPLGGASGLGVQVYCWKWPGSLLLLPSIYLAAPGRPATPSFHRVVEPSFFSTHAARPLAYRSVGSLDYPVMGRSTK